MIEKKIALYKKSINVAKNLIKSEYVDKEYYDGLITKFEKLLKFYENLKK